MSLLGFIGAGHIVEAMTTGFLLGEAIRPGDMGVYDVSAAQTEAFAQKGFTVYPSIQELVAACPYVVIAVKPQIVGNILPAVKEALTPDTVVISVAAGVPVERIRGELGEDCKIVLCIPNTPIALGCGATALARTPNVSEKDFEPLRNLFADCGLVEEIPVDKMREVIPVSSSSPAFAYYMADVIAEEAAAVGLDGDTALRLFCQTLIGSAEMLLQTGLSPKELVRQVSTPGGITEAALEIMNQNGYDRSLREGFRLCVSRAREIGS